MTRRQLLLLTLGAAAVIVAAVVFLALPPKNPSPESASTPSSGPGSGTSAPSNATAGPASKTNSAAKPTPMPRLTLAEEIRALMEKFRRGEASAADLEALRQKLLGADPRVAIAAILEFLRSGDDAATGLEFGLGPGGLLSGAPTMRTFLMDLLGQISRNTGSDAAASFARTVLQTKTTPEEWALSLRNIGWHEPTATAYLSSKMREMLAEPAWTATPSPGLLEAFDVIVFSGDPTWIPALAEMARGTGGGLTDLQRAALVALDRLSESSPLAVMNFLNANPGELADKPMLRADYYAKVDLTQPAQQTALEAYLSRQDVGLDEKTKLIKELAAPASFISDSLLTKPLVVQNENARQQALVKTLSTWANSNRFPQLTGAIQQVLPRLQ